MYGCIDIGNTKLKWAVYATDGTRQETGQVPHWDAFVATFPVVVQAHGVRWGMVSSVNTEEREWRPFLEGILERVWGLSAALDLPLTLAYSTPKTLGNDRLAVAAAAVARFPGMPVLVVDAGTCITYDFVTEEGVYLGGSICPGIDMRFRAMHEQTARLPLAPRTDLREYTGDSTLTSLQTGVLWGVVHELQGFRNQYEAEYGPIQVLVTGGSTPHFETHVKSQIFAEPFLVLDGLYTVLRHVVASTAD